MTEKDLKQTSEKMFKVSKDILLIGMRFFDAALSRMLPREGKGYLYPVYDGKNLYYSAEVFLKQCKASEGYCLRLMLHCMMHYIFSHPFEYSKIENEENRKYFSIAADIAVEAVVLEFSLSRSRMVNDDKRKEWLRSLRKNTGRLTAKSIYRYFLVNGISSEGKKELVELFSFDSHVTWDIEEASISLKDWQNLSERIKAEVKTFSKNLNHSEVLDENLEEATTEKYDYEALLSRFSMMGESLMINDDEFDYIYYTYGLAKYGNMPLVEPLEYKDIRKIREFVIVLDTSSSCKGNIVRAFVRKTAGILKSRESFFSKINIHIIQCDNEVRQDTKITCEQELDYFLKNCKITGFGGTDFRPAFEYVNSLIYAKEFDNLKGLIYFTDGYGIYPEKMPVYDSMFVFLSEDENRQEVPPWAVKVVLGEENLMD